MKCIHPFQVRNDNNEHIPVPCGKCPPCLSRRASSWSFRLVNETKYHISQEFITLTYDTQHVPIVTGQYPMSLSKQHVQDFIKRVRKHNSDRIKYFAVGEYGSQKNRPHYHIIIFGASKEAIAKSWQFGQIYFGYDTSPAAIGYCLKYISKPGKVPETKNDRRTPEFQLVSKGMGIGYITEQSKKFHQSDLTNCVLNIPGGSKIMSMPRYYKQKIYTKEQLGILKGIQEAQAKIKELETEELTQDQKLALYNKQYTNYKKNRKL